MMVNLGERILSISSATSNIVEFCQGPRPKGKDKFLGSTRKPLVWEQDLISERKIFQKAPLLGFSS